jgi:hypothetical protein
MKKEIKPKLFLVAIEETEFWDSDSVEKFGEIWSIGLVDKSLHHYLCSLSPSLLVYSVDFATTKKLLNDDDYDIISHDYWLATESSDYYSANSKFIQLDVTKYFIDDFPGYDNHDDYQEWINDAIDYFKGNSFELDLLGDKLDS